MPNTFKSYGVNNNTASANLYVVPAATTTTAIGLVVSNRTAGTVTANVTINRGANTYYVIQQAPILTGSALVTIGGDQKVVLMANDFVQVSSSANTDAWISVLELS